MKPQPILFEATVRAFRELTDAATDGSATRARVLARAGQRAARRGALRRLSLPIVVTLVLLSLTSAAWTIGARFCRAPAPAILDDGTVPVAQAWTGQPPRRVIPSAVPTPDPPSETTSDSAESRAYGRAHRAHFTVDAPARALAAWDEYLAAYPRGVFAPEARYNRALCLIRLDRLSEAARVLRPFAQGVFDQYRREEARMLLDWLRDRLAADRAARRAPRSL
jgi:hypothetical protein